MSVVVLGVGLRCGSTLIESLLSSHPDVMIWGEHLGQLRELLTVHASPCGWSQTLGQRSRGRFQADGHQSFMTNLTPEADDIDDAVRAFGQRRSRTASRR